MWFWDLLWNVLGYLIIWSICISIIWAILSAIASLFTDDENKDTFIVLCVIWWIILIIIYWEDIVNLFNNYL